MLDWSGRIDARDDLSRRCGCPRESDDAALVLAAHERWGIAGLAHVIGDWSAVLRDGANASVILASDFAGVRPLYYHRQPGRVVWSSSLPALVAAAGIDALDEAYVAGLLTCGGYPGRTPYAGVFSVPAGHAVCLSAGGTYTRALWEPPVGAARRYADERQYDDEFRTLFRDAVATRLRTPGSAIAELSGGLDSSSVVCQAQRLITTGAVTTQRLATVSYVNADSADLPFVRAVEAHCGLDGVHLSTHEHPLLSTTPGPAPTPEAWMPLHVAVAARAQRIGARVFLTGLNGDLANGNSFDDSLQVAAALRRALEIEPDNALFKTNLERVERQLRATGPASEAE